MSWTCGAGLKQSPPASPAACVWQQMRFHNFSRATFFWQLCLPGRPPSRWASQGPAVQICQLDSLGCPATAAPRSRLRGSCRAPFGGSLVTRGACLLAYLWEYWRCLPVTIRVLA